MKFDLTEYVDPLSQINNLEQVGLACIATGRVECVCMTALKLSVPCPHWRNSKHLEKSIQIAVV